MMNQDDIIRRFNELQRELRDLKTARLLPSNMTTYSQTITIPSNLHAGQQWTIHYTQNSSGDAPITTLAIDAENNQTDVSYMLVLRPYDFNTNTQKIYANPISDYFTVSPFDVAVLSTRLIASITQD